MILTAATVVERAAVSSPAAAAAEKIAETGETINNARSYAFQCGREKSGTVERLNRDAG